jgi:uncharacterized protein YndB with AHSA1/START domain
MQIFGVPKVSELTQSDRHGGEVGFEIPIVAAPATVFSLLTDSKLMSCWLAQDVIARPQPRGAFRLWDPKGCWVEGAYVELIPDRLVAFTWGGIEGLTIGQSIVTFSLELDSHATVVELRHSHLPDAAVGMHRLGWMQFGLPRLKALAEGVPPRGTCLGDIAEYREDTPYLLRFRCPRLSCNASAFDSCGAPNYSPNR